MPLPIVILLVIIGIVAILLIAAYFGMGEIIGDLIDVIADVLFFWE